MKSIVIGTAGHIDHGKSALVRALTGTDPDRLKEEQARGITIDLGFAHLETDGVNLAFVDVPGHERFVKNMLAGAGGIDLVMLVVAADESVMPQTREHFQICRLLHVPAGVIVLTKADLADAETRELAALEVRELTAGSFLEAAPLVMVSARTGEGLDELRRTLVRAAAAVPARPADGVARLPIDRVFTMRGFGTVVTGTLVSGELRQDQELVAQPRGEKVKVRGLQVHGRAAAAARAGNRVAVNVGGVELSDLQRGDTLCPQDTFEPTRRADITLELLSDARPLRHGTRVRIHQGTSELLGRIAIGRSRAAEEGSTELRPGGSAWARLRLEAPAVLTRGDRFIVRAYSPPATIGGGIVLDPQPTRGPIRTPAGLRRFERLDTADVAAALGLFVEERGLAGLPRRALVSRAGLAPGRVQGEIERLTRAGHACVVGDLLVSTQAIDGGAAQLAAALQAHHREQPLSDGMPREEARERFFGRAGDGVFDYVLERMVAAGRIVARDRIALVGHRVSLSPEEQQAEEALERVYRDARLAPPDVASAAAAAGTSAQVADRVLKLLVRRNRIVRVDTLMFHVDALDGLKRDVRALKVSAPAKVDVAAFKERYAVTRKYAIPLLEYLDRERVTRRAGESRVIL